MKNKDIGVIGTGFVGSQVIRWFKGCAYYSLDKGDFDEVNKKPIVFLCLPTPYDEKYGFDISAIIQNLKRLTPPKIIVLKSTLIPGTTRMLSIMFPGFDFYFNPEFLREKTAWENFIKPDRQVIGVADKTRLSKVRAGILLKLLPKANNEIICAAKTAEMTKLIANDFLALKVVFAEIVFDYCQRKQIDYYAVMDIVGLDKRIGHSHFDVGADGYRGYGGHCFPKDMKATIWDSGDKFFEYIDKLNDYYVQLS